MELFELLRNTTILLLFGACLRDGFTLVTSNIQIEAGGTAILTCPLKNGNSSILWIHLASNVLYFDGNNRNPILGNQTRYQIVGDDNVGEYKLQINNVGETDQGKYRCDTEIEGKIVSAFVTLYVTENMTEITTTDNRTTLDTKYTTGFSLPQAILIYALAVSVILMLPVIVAVAIKQIRVSIYTMQRDRKQNSQTEDTADHYHTYETINEEDNVPLEVLAQQAEQNDAYLDCIIETPRDSDNSNEDDGPELPYRDSVCHKPYNCLEDNWQEKSAAYDTCSLSS